MAPLSETRAPALVFVGFMGAGKSTAARIAAEAGLEVVDADERLAGELGVPIAEFFAAEGEGEFRRREEALCVELLERADGGAIALGGGSVESERVRAALDRHVVVWLEVDPDEAWARVSRKGDRPLAADREAFEARLADRRDVYAGLADAVVQPGEKARIARALPFLRALGDLGPGTRMAWAVSASGEYPAFVGPGLLGASPLGLAAQHGGADPVAPAGRGYAVTDSNVLRLHGQALAGLEATIEVPAGEGAKTLAEAERVLRELTAMGATRGDHVVALGGGVVGDLAGFCAATYQRGVPVVQLPTTLVAQVDSAYGGKTGVDLPEAKNYVGAYHQPAAVIADTASLETLPDRELAAGQAEVLKTGLLAGGSLWERIRGLEPGPPPDDVIFGCALTKLRIVAADERDSGARQTLNLGHTIGHAIETASGYDRYRHGEAVALGLLAALRISEAGALRAEVSDFAARHGLPTTLDPSVESDAVIEAAGRDKKRTAAGLRFVLLERPGEPTLDDDVSADRVRAAVEELRGS